MHSVQRCFALLLKFWLVLELELTSLPEQNSPKNDEPL